MKKNFKKSAFQNKKSLVSFIKSRQGSRVTDLSVAFHKAVS